MRINYPSGKENGILQASTLEWQARLRLDSSGRVGTLPVDFIVRPLSRLTTLAVVVVVVVLLSFLSESS